MSILSRTLQRQILEALAKRYPEPHTDTSEMLGLFFDDRRLLANLAYLDEHGLIAVRRSEMSDGTRFFLPCITAAGLDFLEDDGGLGAILGVVTVRFEAETLRALIASRIDASAMPAEEKSRIKAALREMPAEMLKAAATRLVEAGLDHLGEALDGLQTLLG